MVCGCSAFFETHDGESARYYCLKARWNLKYPREFNGADVRRVVRQVRSMWCVEGVLFLKPMMVRVLGATV